MDTGQAIKELRLENNMTVRELAKQANISYSYLSNIENGRQKLSHNIAIKIIKAFSNNIKESMKDERLKLLFETYMSDFTKNEIELITPLLDHVNENYLEGQYNINSVIEDGYKDIRLLIIDLLINRIKYYNGVN